MKNNIQALTMKLVRAMFMAQSMVTATYKDSSFAGMSNNPHQWRDAIRKILSTLDTSLDTPHMAPDGKLFMEVSGTTEAVCALMIVVGAPGSVTDINVVELFSVGQQQRWMKSAPAVMDLYKSAHGQKKY